KSAAVSQEDCEQYASILQPSLEEILKNHNQMITVNTYSPKINSSNSLISNDEEWSPDLLTASPQYKSPASTISRDSEVSDDSSFEWYSYTWNDKVPEYKFEENDSDEDNTIDEIRRQIRIKKEKVKPTM
ncbi:2164_t:CDS:2, partial [Gigaspora rosea]